MSKTPKTPASSARLTALEARQAELEKRIAELERAVARQLPAPWVWPSEPTPHPIWPSAEDAKCHVCGNRWADMTHYVCNNDRCPNRVWCGDSIHPSFVCGGSSVATDRTLNYTQSADSTTKGAPGIVSG